MKLIKSFLVVAFALLLSSFSGISYAAVQGEGMSANEQTEQEANYYYRYKDGTIAVNEWKQVWDCWYYFDENGKTKQNTWVEINGKWYYFDSFSIMLHDTTTPDGYTVGSDGVWIESEPQKVEADTAGPAGPGQ